MTCQILDIHRFETDQFAPLLQAESRVWREDLGWDFSASAQLISTCLEEKRLSGYALLIENRIRGYCLFFYDGEKGMIGDLFAEPAAEISQVRSLLECAVEKLVGNPGLRRIEAQLPHFTYEQLEPCFRARCFKGYSRRFMALSLTNRLSRAPAFGAAAPGFAPEGQTHPDQIGTRLADFLLVPWERKHDREAAQLLYWTYLNHVDTAINDQYGSVVGTSRLIENIVHHCGCGEYLPWASLAAIHRSTQKLAGVLALTAIGPKSAHIPQVAIAAQFQGLGLGTALLEASFQELARQGYREVSLTVTDLNPGAVRLYERLGFETFRPFGAFVWTRPDQIGTGP